MEQRRLRLGDILDDYCPRERRVTNHAVVAMIEDAVKQTRCTTCDAEHPYKGAKVPRKRKKETPGALYREVLAGVTDGEPAPVLAASAPVAENAAFEEAAPPHEESAVEEAPAPMQAGTTAAVAEEEEFEAPHAAIEEGPVHRPLIRATLPRPEGQKEERRIPEFTVRHNAGRPGNFRGGDMRAKQRGGFGGNGNRGHGGPRVAGGRPVAGRGQGRGGQQSGFRSGQPQQRHGGGGRKRSR